MSSSSSAIADATSYLTLLRNFFLDFPSSSDNAANLFLLTPSNSLIQDQLAVVYDDNGECYVCLFPLLTNAIWNRILAMRDDIVRASHSYVLGTMINPTPTILRDGTLEELRVMTNESQLQEDSTITPPIFTLISGAQGINPLSYRPLPAVEWAKIWMAVMCAGLQMASWIENAKQKTRKLAGKVSWAWDREDLVNDASLCHIYNTELTLNNQTTGPFLDTAPYTPVPMEGMEGGNTMVEASDPMEGVDFSEMTNTDHIMREDCKDLILHSIWSLDARNALVPLLHDEYQR